MVLLSDLLSYVTADNILFPNHERKLLTISDSSNIFEAMKVSSLSRLYDRFYSKTEFKVHPLLVPREKLSLSCR